MFIRVEFELSVAYRPGHSTNIQCDDHTLFCLQITKSDISPQVKRVVNLVIADRNI